MKIITQRHHSLGRLVAQSATPLAFRASNASGGAMIAESGFPRFEGPIAALSHARIGLNTGSATRFYQHTPAGLIEGLWQGGDLTVTLPGMAGDCRVDASSFIGLAVDPASVDCEDCRIIADDLANAARGFTRDPMIASVMMALRHAAEIHGASTAFFDHGLALVLSRLATLNGRCTVPQAVRPLAQSQLKRVLDLIEEHLAEDLSVDQMAAVVGQNRSSFSRAFAQSTGFAPFAWLTRRRMERAKEMLADGLPVTAVALAVGYANPGKFAAAFRRLCGVSPSRWPRR